jgi:hypothetical protein
LKRCQGTATDAEQQEMSFTNATYVAAPEPNANQQIAYPNQPPITHTSAVKVFSLALNSYILMQPQSNWYPEKPMDVAPPYGVEIDDKSPFAHTDQQPTEKQLYN